MSEGASLNVKEVNLTGWKATIAFLAIIWCLGSGVVMAGLLVVSVFR